jgi:hypothetical protein
MTLDEAIKHSEEVAKEERELFSLCPIPSKMCNPHKNCGILGNDGEGRGCLKCAEEHEQLAKWLKQLQDVEKIVGEWSNDLIDYEGHYGDDYMEKIEEVIENNT